MIGSNSFHRHYGYFILGKAQTKILSGYNMTKFAVVKIGSKQYRVFEKQKISIEKLTGKVNDKVIFDQVLLISDNKIFVGQPTIQKAQVEARIINQGKLPKIKVIKFKPKKRYKKVQGHRQFFTEIEILKIKK